MEASKFQEKIGLMCDPYFDREFFTNLIYCIDRKKTVRDIFEASLQELSGTPRFTEEIDKSLLHLMYAYQASSMVRDNYQWLPLCQGIYSAALFRGDGKSPISSVPSSVSRGQAATPEEFSEWIRGSARAVESQERAWSALLFLLENRTTRSKTISIVLKQALAESDTLTFQMLVKAFDLALASGWHQNAVLLRRPFERFWSAKPRSEIYSEALRLVKAGSLQEKSESDGKWQASFGDEIWQKAATQSAESVWEFVEKLLAQGAWLEQIFASLAMLRGRALYAMKTEQWPRVTASIMLGDALHAASRWLPEEKATFLAASICEFVHVAQLVGVACPSRPTGDSILAHTSNVISKDRLILRLDDVVERGLRHEALELMAVILGDAGLSNTVSDRLVLMASKQDAWTFDQRTIPVAAVLAKSYETCLRLNVTGETVTDGIYGLLRFLSDEREVSLEVVPRTGTYGEGLPPSQFDVNGGARNVNRFVFNQVRNAQRVKVWPSDD